MGDWLVIAVRFALYADLMTLAGLVAFSLCALNDDERRQGVLPLVWPVTLLTLAGLLLSVFGMLVLVAGMMGTNVFEIDSEAFRGIVGETAIGTAWLVRMAVLVFALGCGAVISRWPGISQIGVLMSATLALVTLVWTGHAGATEGGVGTLHRVSDVVHMLAASVWIGGIVAFIWLLFRPAAGQVGGNLAATHRALDEFSRIGTIAVALIVITGIINSSILLGLPSLAELAGSTYVRLLLAKLALFGGMLLLAASNRWRLTPALGRALHHGNSSVEIRALRISLILEVSAALAVLALVAWLGTLEPLRMAG